MGVNSATWVNLEYIKLPSCMSLLVHWASNPSSVHDFPKLTWFPSPPTKIPALLWKIIMSVVMLFFWGKSIVIHTHSHFRRLSYWNRWENATLYIFKFQNFYCCIWITFHSFYPFAYLKYVLCFKINLSVPLLLISF